MYKFVAQLISKTRQTKQSIRSIPQTLVEINYRSLHIKPKDTKSSGAFKTIFKGFIYVEIAFLATSYLLWKHMNNSQEFRFYLNQKLPLLLESIKKNYKPFSNKLFSYFIFISTQVIIS